MLYRSLLSACVFLGTSAFAVIGAAQTVPPPPPAPAPTPVEAGAPNADPAATPAQPPPAAAAPVVVEKAPEDIDKGGRIRWGTSGNVGWHLPQSMFTIGAEGRIGYQVNNIFSAYGIVGGTAGFGFSANAGFSGVSVTASAISYWYIGGIAEAMFGNVFYVGGGPVLARGGLGGASIGVDSSGVAQVQQVASSGFKPGINLRLGFGFGRPLGESHRRSGFNLGIDTLTLFHPNTTVVTTKADGPNGSAGVSVTTNETIVSFVPMLTFGYDSR